MKKQKNKELKEITWEDYLKEYYTEEEIERLPLIAEKYVLELKEKQKQQEEKKSTRWRDYFEAIFSKKERQKMAIKAKKSKYTKRG